MADEKFSSVENYSQKKCAPPSTQKVRGAHWYDWYIFQGAQGPPLKYCVHIFRRFQTWEGHLFRGSDNKEIMKNPVRGAYSMEMVFGSLFGNL